MKNKILVPYDIGYGSSIMGLGDITDDLKDFYNNTNDFKLVLFTGGADVGPELYGDSSPKGLCFTNFMRDEVESKIFIQALKHSIPMTGICRGAQFINVMSGGKMIHDFNGHGYGNHAFNCLKDNGTISVNSLHHQMIVPPEDGYVIGWCPQKLSDEYYGYRDRRVEWDQYEVEAVLIPRTMCCGVQYHPETMDSNSEGYKWYYDMVEDLITMDINLFVHKYTGGKKYVSVTG